MQWCFAEFTLSPFASLGAVRKRRANGLGITIKGFRMTWEIRWLMQSASHAARLAFFEKVTEALQDLSQVGAIGIDRFFKLQ